MQLSNLEIKRKIKHAEKMRDFYSGNNRSKKLWRGEVKKWNLLLSR